MLPAAPLPFVFSHTTSPDVGHGGAPAEAAVEPTSTATVTAAAASAASVAIARERRINERIAWLLFYTGDWLPRPRPHPAHSLNGDVGDVARWWFIHRWELDVGPQVYARELLQEL